MMTTMAALLGGLPMALGRDRLGTAPPTGNQHRRRPDGQPASHLYTTPVVYLYMERLRLRLASMRGKVRAMRIEPGRA